MKMFGKSFLYCASSAIALFGFIAPSSANTLKLTAPDGERFDYFGDSVAIDGNYALVGASGAGDRFDKGSAYLFDTTTGNLLHKLTAPDAAPYDYFGNSVAIDGNYALVGAWKDDSIGDNNSGSAYLFDITTGGLLHKLTAPDGGTRNGSFGQSLAIDGNYILIGAHGDASTGGNPTGSSYLFDTTTGNFIRKLIPPNRKPRAFFGRSLAMDGDYALIGAIGGNDNGEDSGSAYLFDTTTGNLLHRLIAPDGAQGDNFGYSVAIDGNYALVGSHFDDDNGEDSGSAYLFDTTTGDLLHKLTAPDASWPWRNQQFGGSVAIDGNYALIGAHGDSDNGYQSGSVYLFDTIAGDLLQKLTAPDAASEDWFGGSVAMDGNSVIIGARMDDDNGINSGSAYLFSLNPQTNPELEPVPEPASLLGLLAVGVATVTGLKKGKSDIKSGKSTQK